MVLIRWWINGDNKEEDVDIEVNPGNGEGNDDTGNGTKGKVSYAKAVRGEGTRVRIPVKVFHYAEDLEDSPVDLPIENIRDASLPFVHTLYGYFVGAKMAYPTVNYSLSRMWKIFGVEDISMNKSGFFFFKFDGEYNMRMVLDSGPWMVNDVPLFLQRWRPGLALSKPNHNKVPVWVKVYDLPLEAWSGDNLCRIFSKIGVPLSFDSYTEDMCINHKGRNAYARMLVEMSAEKKWKESVEVNTWDFLTNSAVLQKFEIEYAWRPDMCLDCKIYGHSTNNCAKVIAANKLKASLEDALKADKSFTDGIVNNIVIDEGFTMVSKKNGKK